MVATTLKRLFKSIAESPRAEPDSKRLASEIPAKRIKQIEKKLGYVFRNKGLLVKSLIHPSYLLGAKDQINNNQRLEFLGDAVIQLVLTETLYYQFPKEREGKLTSLRSGYARGDYMAEIARRLNLNEFLLLKSRDREAGVAEQDSALGDVFESVIGAVYLDSDWATARDLVLSLYDNLQQSPEGPGTVANPKGALQEHVQPRFGNDALRYETTKAEGQPHERLFEISVYCNDELLGSGKGRTKKEASEKAALEALALLQKRK